MATDTSLGFLTPTVPDKQLDAGSLTTGAGTVLRERHQLGGGAGTELADVKAAAPTTGMFGLVTYPFLPTDGAGHQTPAADAVARALFARLSDGVTNVGVDAGTGGLKAFIVGGGGGGTSSNFGSAFPASGTAAGASDGTNMLGLRGAAAGLGTLGASLFGLVVRPYLPSDGTNTTPAGDALARARFAKAALIDSGGGDATDTVNHAVKVNVVAGIGAGGTSSAFAVAFPGFGTALGLTDGTNMVPGRSVVGPIPDFTLSGMIVSVNGMLGNNTSLGATSPFALPVGGYRNPTAPSADGKFGALALNAAGDLRVAIMSGAGSGGTAMADLATFTLGTTSLTPIGGVFQTSLPADLTNNQTAVPLLTKKRGLQVNPVDSLGIEMTDTALHALNVKIVADAAGSAVDTDDGSVAAGQASLALAIAQVHGFDGTVWRRIKSWSGGQAVSEQAAQGTPTIAQVTVDATTTNGVQLKAANSTGTRRRLVVTNHGTTPVMLGVGATGLTAGAATAGEMLAGVAGAEKSFFTSAEVRATVTTGTQVVAVREEVLV
jgi:hypothetical protein